LPIIKDPKTKNQKPKTKNQIPKSQITSHRHPEQSEGTPVTSHRHPELSLRVVIASEAKQNEAKRRDTSHQ
jgi:hypothetical protein